MAFYRFLTGGFAAPQGEFISQGVVLENRVRNSCSFSGADSPIFGGLMNTYKNDPSKKQQNVNQPGGQQGQRQQREQGSEDRKSSTTGSSGDRNQR